MPDAGDDRRPKKQKKDEEDNSLDHLLGSGTEPCKKFQKGCNFKLVVTPKMDKELLDLLPNRRAEHNSLVEPRLDVPQTLDREQLDEPNNYL